MQPVIPPKHFDIPPDRGMLRKSRCVQITDYLGINSRANVQVKTNIVIGYP